MAFFEHDDHEPSHLKLAEFESYYKDDQYVFLSADQWEALYQYYMYEAGENDFQKVKFIIYEALSQHQYSVFFTLRMAEIHCRSNNLDQTISYLELAKTLSPTDFDVYETSAQVYEHFKMYDKAIENFKAAYQNGANRFDILFQMALCYLNANKKTAALNVFRRLSVMQPQNEFVLDHLAMLIFDNEWYEEGLAIYSQVIDAKPYSETAWHYYGNTFAGLEQFDKALWAQEMVIAINDHNYLGHFGIASTYQEQERYSEAIQKYEELITHFDEDSLIYTNLGYCAEKLNFYEKARAYYRKAISLDLQTPSAWYGIGMSLVAENKYRESVYFLINAYKYGKNEDSHYGLSLAQVYAKINAFEQAEEIFETLIRIFPDQHAIWVDYSALYSEQGNYEMAADTLETAAFYLPDSHQINYRLAALNLKLERINKASVYLEKALNSNYKDHNLLYLFDPSIEKDKTIQSLIKQYKK